MFILVIRKSLSVSSRVDKILNNLTDSLVETREQSEWITGKLFGDVVKVYYYKTTDQAKSVLKDVSNSLHQWVQPNFPEDLSFTKNGNPWLINIAHEHESYIKTDDKHEIGKILSIKGLNIRL
jgi:hypothetical protein